MAPEYKTDLTHSEYGNISDLPYFIQLDDEEQRILNAASYAEFQKGELVIALTEIRRGAISKLYRTTKKGVRRLLGMHSTSASSYLS